MVEEITKTELLEGPTHEFVGNGDVFVIELSRKMLEPGRNPNLTSERPEHTVGQVTYKNTAIEDRFRPRAKSVTNLLEFGFGGPNGFALARGHDGHGRYQGCFLTVGG